MTMFMNKRPFSQTKFLYFNANDLTQPKVKDRFRVFEIDSVPCYITPGYNKNFWYVYRESVIKYLVNVKLKNGMVYDVNIVGSGPSHDVNHGDHVDIGIICTRSQDIVVKTHKTLYVDLGNYVFDRRAPECNFLYDPSKLSDEKTFDTTRCVDVNNTYCNDITNIYKDSLDRKIILHLCKTMSTSQPGGRKKHVGGGIHDSKFIEFASNVLEHLGELRQDILDVKIIDDESVVDGNIVFLIDFVDYTRSILLVPKNKQNLDSKLKKELAKLRSAT